jgi:hypothetical protein
MEAVRTSETSVNSNVTTRRYIPEDSKLLLAAVGTRPLTGSGCFLKSKFVDYPL